MSMVGVSIGRLCGSNRLRHLANDPFLIAGPQSRLDVVAVDGGSVDNWAAEYPPCNYQLFPGPAASFRPPFNLC